MKIAYVASEVSPFASTGGLAEVAGSLPEALVEQGHEVLRFMPMYRTVLDHAELRPTGIELKVPLGFHTYRAEIWESVGHPVKTYFIRRDEYFDRSFLYTVHGRDYEDNFERFVFFQKAVTLLIDHLRLAVDVVHGNDWQCGLLPYFLMHGVQGQPRPKPEPFVLTLHNIAYQGIFPGSEYAQTHLPFHCFSVEHLEYYGQINCLKGGITAAKAITTVSPTHAREIRTREWAYGLEGVLGDCAGRLTGILNGIDARVWDPAHDENLARTYQASDRAGKGTCRDAFLSAQKLKVTPSTTLISMITRLVDQKGMDLLAECMSDVIKRDVAFCIHGEGEDKYHALGEVWQKQWPDRFRFLAGYRPGLARQILAASDFMLMPSRLEPCGLSQFYGMRYGALPVAHAVGGLADAIHDVKEDGSEGTGILFRRPDREALMSAIDRALDLRSRPIAYAAVQRRAMEQDLSWHQPARAYADLYAKVAGR